MSKLSKTDLRLAQKNIYTDNYYKKMFPEAYKHLQLEREFNENVNNTSFKLPLSHRWSKNPKNVCIDKPDNRMLITRLFDHQKVDNA